jgi:hypothetical protein
VSSPRLVVGVPGCLSLAEPGSLLVVGYSGTANESFGVSLQRTGSKANGDGAAPANAGNQSKGKRLETASENAEPGVKMCDEAQVHAQSADGGSGAFQAVSQPTNAKGAAARTKQMRLDSFLTKRPGTAQ